MVNEILGFEFNDNPGRHTIYLADEKRDALLKTLGKWIKGSRDGSRGIPFEEFRQTVAKLRHAFTSIPAGAGLLSPYSGVLGK